MADDAEQSVFAFLRFDTQGAPLLSVSNFTPIPRPYYRLGVPIGGVWLEIFNSDAAGYGGSGAGNLGQVTASARPAHGFPSSLELLLPPLATIFLRPMTPADR
jgi:1,4-alpha-glucan branching enzyme